MCTEVKNINHLFEVPELNRSFFTFIINVVKELNMHYIFIDSTHTALKQKLVITTNYHCYTHGC